MDRADEKQLRIDLAAALRLAAYYDWHEGVANHFSAAVSPDGRKFLVNPRWKHFSRARASELLLVDADDPETMKRPDAPDPSAWSIHSAIHRRVPHARVALHLHPPYATTLATLKDPSIKPVDQVTARFFNRMAMDMSFGGIATEEAEGERIAASIGNYSVVMMANHGVTTVAPTVAEAFDAMYHLERAARTMVLAYSTGQELNVMSDELADSVAREWEVYKDAEYSHFEEMKLVLDRENPGYAD
ncbi:MAG: class II aldolase/adducin family protein [Hoeflea sp.]|nr:class II aldolase/adducin family protein [Alphaproteobacteria bacterium]MBV1725618.1 class II aldolase/adducin family protein [Hoeflea sp.]MBU4546875.1 class II aldolase/adducin family protein [Alphaproteobacteria bacterium]MBU4551613.1 class II aldolase/adducin family protein [Alphaproteobacteria bacterium]MBV1759666.1 class II aldolase/adducin family protein [Hoeflea sp.]